MKKKTKTKRIKKPEHKHDFKLAGLSIYCDCGMTTKLDCPHVWIHEHTSNITIDKAGWVIHQTEIVYHCSKCGAVRHTNTTTGNTNIVH